MTADDQKNAAMFMQLILTFQTAAWQQMGKLKNPLTDKIERDLNQARFSIDMLDMIRTKTAGNLTEDENMLLDKVISELQLNYVAEANRPEKEEPEKETEEKAVEEKAPKEKAKEKKKGKGKHVKKKPSDKK